MTIVYDGGRQTHMNTEWVHTVVRILDEQNQSGSVEVRGIDDATAQTIASWWHSPGNTNTTLLSTMGQVSNTTHASDFFSDEEFDGASKMDQLCLLYLEAYIIDKQDDYNNKQANGECSEDCFCQTMP